MERLGTGMQAQASTIAPPAGPERFDADLASATVLVVDDEPGMRNFLSKTLSGVCARVDVTEHTSEASALMDQYSYDVIVLDNIMPNKSGVEWLAEQKRIGLFSDTILITAYADLETAIAALRAGASDFLLKPFRSNQILNAIAQSLDRTRLRRQNSLLSYELETGSDILRYRSAVLGSSPDIQKVRDDIERVAKSQANVVLRGEVGSGKQVSARMLHAVSARADKPFSWLQCYEMDEDAFRARLFGQIGGGDTRDEDQAGILMNAAGGTLFLDDVQNLSMPCQNVLFELLTTGRFRPLGAERSLGFDMRIVCSCTRPLVQSVEAGSFRPDLYYLLNVVEIALPPLRERAEDVVELARFFLTKLSAQMGIKPPDLSAPVRRRMMAYPWPGNVVELRNAIERVLIHGDFDKALGLPGIEAEIESLATVEKRHILASLDACGGNRAEAARRLGVARKTIDRKCQAWGL